ncbi:MAG: hypothetical protein ACE366_16940 [Bradymonadia bacterium]
MVTLLLIWALAAPGQPAFWMERDGTTLRCSANLKAMSDEALVEKLKSGLTTTLRLKLELVHVDSGEIRGYTTRIARARWDLWDEELYVEFETPGPFGASGTARARFKDADSFLERMTRFRASPIAKEVAITPAVYTVRAVLQVNPLTAEQLARTRQWLWASEDGSLDPLARGLFGSFVRLFENFKTGAAERTLKASSQAFRADRLQFYSPTRRSPDQGP